MKAPFCYLIHSTYRHLVLAVCTSFLVAGVLFSFSFPPFQVADEDLHWVNANQWSEELIARATGREPMVCSVGAVLPTAFNVNPTKNSYSVKQTQGELASVASLKPGCHGRPPITIASVLSYPGVLLARLVIPSENYEGVPALYSFVASRILQGALVFLVLLRLWFKLKARPDDLTPGTLTLAVFCVGPMFINQSFGVTYDMVTLLFSISAATCLIFRKQTTWTDLAILAASGAIACSTKPVFVPVGLAALGVLLIDALWDSGASEGSQPARRRGWVPALFATAALLAGAGVLTTLTDFSDIKEFFKNDPNIDPAYNKAFLFADPKRAVSVLWGSIRGFLHLNVIATPLGWMNVGVSARSFGLWVYSLKIALVVDLLVGLWLVITRSRLDGALVRRGFRACIGGALGVGSIVVLSFATAMALYIRWTPRDTLAVHGLQPRYFLPVFLIGIASLFCVLNGVREPKVVAKPHHTAHSHLFMSVGAIATTVAVVLMVLVPYVVALNMDVMMRFF